MKITIEFLTGKKIELTLAEWQELMPKHPVSVLAPYARMVVGPCVAGPATTLTHTSGYITTAKT